MPWNISPRLPYSKKENSDVACCWKKSCIHWKMIGQQNTSSGNLRPTQQLISAILQDYFHHCLEIIILKENIESTKVSKSDNGNISLIAISMSFNSSTQSLGYLKFDKIL